jgi:hypothetical protein
MPVTVKSPTRIAFVLLALIIEIPYVRGLVKAINIGQAVIGAKPQFGAKLLGTVNVIEPSDATGTSRAATNPDINTVSVELGSFDETPLIVTLVPTGPFAGEIVTPTVLEPVGGNIGPPGWNGNGVGDIGGVPLADAGGGTAPPLLPGNFKQTFPKNARVIGPK